MRELERLFKLATDTYKRGGAPLDALREVCVHALGMLAKAQSSTLPSISAGNKQYWVVRDGYAGPTRPYLPGLFIADARKFVASWNQTIGAIAGQSHRIDLDAHEVNRTLYTATMSFCLCYDLYKPKSRKTPGTQFEVLLGSLLARLMPAHVRTAHIPIPGSEETVATDIVMSDPAGVALVIPAKITTRERVVQPFAHQRILDSVFGQGRYRSVLACVSEMQRDEEQGANEVCVPGTIRLFQRHLAALSGIYYLDPPTRYLQPDLTEIVRVGSLGELFTTDLPKLVPPPTTRARTPSKRG